MPCYDGRDSYEETRKEFTHNSPVAEMLCSVIAVLIGRGEPLPPVAGLDKWWKDHWERDVARAARPRRFITKLETLEMTQAGQRVRATFQEDDVETTEVSDDPDTVRGWYEMAKHGGP